MMKNFFHTSSLKYQQPCMLCYRLGAIILACSVLKHVFLLELTSALNVQRIFFCSRVSFFVLFYRFCIGCHTTWFNGWKKLHFFVHMTWKKFKIKIILYMKYKYNIVWLFKKKKRNFKKKKFFFFHCSRFYGVENILTT